jgi:hypothetical protein
MVVENGAVMAALYVWTRSRMSQRLFVSARRKSIPPRTAGTPTAHLQQRSGGSNPLLDDALYYEIRCNMSSQTPGSRDS